jgi:hypothetical protein
MRTSTALERDAIAAHETALAIEKEAKRDYDWSTRLIALGHAPQCTLGFAASYCCLRFLHTRVTCIVVQKRFPMLLCIHELHDTRRPRKETKYEEQYKEYIPQLSRFELVIHPAQYHKVQMGGNEKYGYYALLLYSSSIKNSGCAP